MERFELFRLMLQPRLSLPIEDRPERVGFLRDVFGRRIAFKHWGKTFFYVPILSGVDRTGGLAGKIGRRSSSEENLSPDDDFEVVSRDMWKACSIVIDPTHHDEGQKVAMQVVAGVGTPYAILSSLARFINETADGPFHIEVEPIVDASSFWAFAEANRGSITSLSFEFATPNIWGGIDDFYEEMRSFRDKEAAQTVSLSLKSDEGLNTGTKKIESAVAYAARGGGKIKARAKGRKTYNSKKLIKTVQVDQPQSPEGLSQRLVALLDRVFRK